MPLLKKALTYKDADVRIITLGSNASVDIVPPNYTFNFDSPSFLTAQPPSYPWLWRHLANQLFRVDMFRYAISKVASTLFVEELQRRLDEQDLPILSISVHPGAVASEGSKLIGYALFTFVQTVTFVPTEEGAMNSIFAATANEVRGNAEVYKGKFLYPVGKLHASHPVGKDKKQVRGLWDNATAAVNKHLVEIGLAQLNPW